MSSDLVLNFCSDRRAGQIFIRFPLTQISVYANVVPLWIKYGNKREKVYIKNPRNFDYRSDCSLCIF